MKRFVLGLAMFVSGFMGTVLLIAALVCAPESPWWMNGTEGIFNGIIMTKLYIPLIICIAFAIVGLVKANSEA
ncbi:MAG: hypothetical protein IJM50_03315 [Lachnospiraceae bacterium]|nr:hypothetical protein [Lachnospiraceae bacterium]